MGFGAEGLEHMGIVFEIRVPLGSFFIRVPYYTWGTKEGNLI